MWLLVSLDVINCLGFGWCHFYLLLIWIRWVISQIFVPTQLVTCCATKDDAVRFFSQTMFTPAALIGSAALGLLFLPPAKFAFCDPQQQPYRIFQFLYRATWISTGEFYVGCTRAVVGSISLKGLVGQSLAWCINKPTDTPETSLSFRANGRKHMSKGTWKDMSAEYPEHQKNSRWGLAGGQYNTRFFVHKQHKIFASIPSLQSTYHSFSSSSQKKGTITKRHPSKWCSGLCDFSFKYHLFGVNYRLGNVECSRTTLGTRTSWSLSIRANCYGPHYGQHGPGKHWEPNARWWCFRSEKGFSAFL